MKHFRKFIPITKVDVAQRLVYGLATCEKRDRAGETCHYESTVPYYKAWSGEIAKATGDKSFGNVRAMHGKVAAGKLNEQIGYNDDEKQIEICAKIVDDAEWKKVEEGVYSGFSQGGKYVKTWKEGDINFYTAEPYEVSLVDLPCLPESTFAVIKADGTQEMRKFIPTVTEPSTTDLGMRAEKLAKDAGKDKGQWQEFVEAARTEIFDEQIAKAKKESDDKNDPQYPPGNKPDAKDGDAKDPKEKPAKDKGKKKAADKFAIPERPFWKCNCADHEHVNKADAVKCLAAEASVEAAALVTAPLADAITKLKKALAPVDHLAEFVAKSFKDADLTAAQKIIDDPTCKFEDDAIAALTKLYPDVMKDYKKAVVFEGENSVTVEELVKAFNAESTMTQARVIMKAAKEQKITIDDTAKALFVTALEKGLYDVCRLADLISQLKWLVDSAIFEAQIEGDGSTVGNDIKAAAVSLCQCLVAMVQEETAELFEMDDDIAILEMAAGSLSLMQVEQLAKSGAEIKYIDTLKKNASHMINVAGVLEFLKTEFEKKGARHSKADTENIQQMHDLSLQLGAECAAGADKSLDSGDLSKDVENAALKKQIGDLVPMIEGLVKDVTALKAQPLPAKAARIAIGKVEDNGGDTPIEVSDLVAAFEKLSPDQRAHELMKLSLRTPIPGSPAHQGR